VSFKLASFSTIVECISLRIPVFVSQSFIPSIPQIAKDLHTTSAVVKWVPSWFEQVETTSQMHDNSLAVSLSIVTNALGSLCWSSYSSYCESYIVLLETHILTAARRTQTNLYHQPLSAMHRLLGGRIRKICPSAALLARRSGSRLIQWVVCWNGCHWRHLQT
jgi:hypothetical protein